jgi:hypothetical protein
MKDDGTDWICPDPGCDATFGPSTMSQSEAYRRFREHLATGHTREYNSRTEDDQYRQLMDLEDPPTILTEPVVSPRAWDRVEEGTPSSAAHGQQTALRGIKTEQFPFTLLPPGTWDIDDVIKHYRVHARSTPQFCGARSVDHERMNAWKQLMPIKCYRDRELYLGYVVFEFRESKRVVMDCPVEGNAIYILWGDWKRMVGHSKYDLRSNYPDNYLKIVHKGDWLHRVRAALY